jgi:hypothetical protein
VSQADESASTQKDVGHLVDHRFPSEVKHFEWIESVNDSSSFSGTSSCGPSSQVLTVFHCFTLSEKLTTEN